MPSDTGEGGLEPERAWAILCREPFLMTREQFMDLDDWALYNVFSRPDFNKQNDGSKPYWPVPRKIGDEGQEVSFKELCFMLWSKQGMTPEEMEERFVQSFPSYGEVPGG